MVRIFVIANCQLASIQSALAHLVAGVDVRGIELFDPRLLQSACQKDIRQHLADADYVLMQPTAHPFVKEIIEESWLAPKIVKVANMYFRGLHPDIFYLGEFNQRVCSPSQYNSLVVLDAYRRGLSASQALKLFQEDNFSRLGLFKAWTSSIAELRARDEEISFPVADLIEKSSHEFQAFHSINHPSIKLVYLYYMSVVRGLGLTLNSESTPPHDDPFAEQDCPPIYDLVRHHYRLPYSTQQSWKINGWTLSLSAYVQHAYSIYRQYPSHELVAYSPADMVNYLLAQNELQMLAVQ